MRLLYTKTHIYILRSISKTEASAVRYKIQPKEANIPWPNLLYDGCAVVPKSVDYGTIENEFKSRTLLAK